ncbi:hypothetical protein [uncultured Psychroserpens sp.]|uniref:hypothetical protein n=1 Tax=uncultured Psychroserpens sp. TaxID=255436 RepID=UPI00261045B5|nr:hypothetical protein [uncultured Psychroserpens sp.]
MDKKILGNFIIYFPTIAYIAYTIVIKEKGSGIDWTAIVIAGFISMISYAIGNRIKNKGEIE